MRYTWYIPGGQGRREIRELTLDETTEKLATEMLDAGWAFDVETLRLAGSQMSFTVNNGEHELYGCMSNPNADLKTVFTDLVNESYEKWGQINRVHADDWMPYNDDDTEDDESADAF